MSRERMIHVAIPAMNEADFLPATIECLAKQTFKPFKVWVCVNQPEHWWDHAEKQPVCENNQHTLHYLNEQDPDRFRILDHSSRGKGWQGKAHGVGQARKVLMDRISQHARSDDIILSLDADTLFGPDYLYSVNGIFSRYPAAVALSNPYYHPLTRDERLDRAMLRYEIYMRHYAINMWRIRSPYSFTALGSAIAIPVHAYRKIGGMTAKKSGEDFYLLQKLRKTGWICNHNNQLVYPGTRYSDRVYFGTGPALIKGSNGDWGSYPVYDHRLFDMVGKTCDFFPDLYTKPVETPMSDFLRKKFRESDPFSTIRHNASTKEGFVKACHQKIDGLRVLQFLKETSARTTVSDESALISYLQQFHPENLLPEQKGGTGYFSDSEIQNLHALDFEATGITLLNKIRNLLRMIEISHQETDRP